MLTNLNGIILKTQDYGETHKIVTIFTQELGKLNAISRGANKPKSRLSAVSQSFVNGNFLIYVSEGLSTVRQGEMIQSFRHIREDIIKTAYASYVMEFTDKTTEFREPHPYLYKELLSTLTWINEQDDYVIPIIMYELKLFKQAGYAPVLDRCATCQSTGNLVSFSIQYGGLLCDKCQTSDEYTFILEHQVIKMLPILLEAHLEQVGTISVKDKNKKILKMIMDQYYDTYGGFHLKSKRFLAQIDLLQ